MNKKTVIAVVTATTIGLGSLGIGASAWAKGRHGGGERMINRVTEMLSLNEGQVEALKSLQSEVSETRQLMRGDNGGLMGNLTEFVNADSFDQQEALNLINERIAALESNAPELVNAAAVFFDGLSAEQKATMTDKLEKMQKRHGKRADKG